MSAQGDKFRNRPEQDLSTRRTAEDELMRGDRTVEPKVGDRGVGQTGGGDAGGSGTAGGGIENEGTGSLLVDAEQAEEPGAPERAAQTREGEGSGSTKGGSEPGVSGKRGMSSPLEKEGAGHSGPIRSGDSDAGSGLVPTEQDRAAAGNENAEAGDNAREGYEDHGSSRDADGTQGESSGSIPGYR